MDDATNLQSKGSVSTTKQDEDVKLRTDLDVLEADIAVLRLRWWHLLFWTRSPIRPLQLRFLILDPHARTVMEMYRASRKKNEGLITHGGWMGHYQVLPSLQLALQDWEHALGSRLERVRFLLLSKESEEHARRSVLLGWVGIALGVLSLILGIVAWYQTPK